MGTRTDVYPGRSHPPGEYLAEEAAARGLSISLNGVPYRGSRRVL